MSNAKPKVLPQFLCTGAVCAGAFVVGVCLGYTSPAFTDLDEKGWNLDEHEKSWIGSIINNGAMVGCILGMFLLNYLGRKRSIQVLTVPYAAGWALIAGAQNVPMLYAGRFICGISVGSLCVCTPVYVAEMSEKRFRGMLGSAFQLTLCVGMLSVNILGIALDFRWLAIVAIILCGVMFGLMLLVPESPLYLLSKGNEEEAIKSLHWLRGADCDISEELEEHNKANQEASEANWEISDLKQRVNVFPLLLGVLLMMFQQMSSVNILVFYTEGIFKAAGSTIDPKLASCLVMTIQVIATFVCSMTVDKLGRKVLLLSSAAVMCLCTAMFGAFYYIQEKDPDTAAEIGFLPVVSNCLFIAAFSIGYGPIPWIAMGEFFPTKIKSFASGICMLTNWTLSFVITFTYEPMQEAVGNYGVFWFYCGFTVFGFVTMLILLPETKGKTLNEITDMFRKK